MEGEGVDAGVELIVGPSAKKPLRLEMPIFVSDMSFGALSAEAKIAMARGAGTVANGRIETLDLQIASPSVVASQFGRLGLALPGPDALRDVLALPPELDTRGWDRLLGRLHADAELRPGEAPAADVRVDLSDSPWIDRFTVRARADSGRIEVDSLRVAVEGVSLDGSGRTDADSLRAAVGFRADDPKVLRRWAGASTGLEGAVSGTADVAGPRSAPRWETRVATPLSSTA